MLLALGHFVQPTHPDRLGCVTVRIGHAVVHRLTPHLGDLGDVGRAALAAFYLDRFHAHLLKLGQEFQRVEAGGLLNGVVVFVGAHIEAALAQRGVAGVFAGCITVDQHTVQA